jgi:hypothetical protein
MSEAPRRLLDDPALSPSLRDDLAAARDGADVRYDEGKGLERLRAAIAVGAPPGTGAGGGTGAGSTGTGAGALGGAKAFLIGSAAVAVVAGAVGIGLWSRHTPAPAPRAPVPTGAAASSAATAPAPTETPNDGVPTVSLSDLPAESAAAPSPRPSASSESAEDRLHAEMAQLAEIRSAPPARALALADEGNRTFKGGIFYQEREALAIGALVRLGRSGEAKSRAQAFLARYPKGPYAERIRAETGIEAPAAPER